MSFQEDWDEEPRYMASYEPDAMDSMFVTFGAASVSQNGTFLNVNGDTTSIVNTTSALVGNTFVVGEPLWVYRITVHKSTDTPSSITFVKISAGITSSHSMSFAGTSQTRSGNRGLFFHPRDMLQLRVNVTSNFPPPGKILLTLFFRPLMNQNLRLQSFAPAEIPSSSILTLGGNMKTAGRCFTVNGDVGSLEIGAENPGSVFVVGIPFTIHVIAWYTPSTQTSGIQFLKNGQIYGPSWGIASAGLMGGMEGKWPYMFDAGDILQIRYSQSTEQRRHLVWVYVRPIAAY